MPGMKNHLSRRNFLTASAGLAIWWGLELGSNLRPARAAEAQLTTTLHKALIREHPTA